MTLRPCLDCGEPCEGVRCGEHARPDRGQRHSGATAGQRGYGWTWQQLSQRARRMQPFCSDCGSTQDLTADHLPGAWQRVQDGKPLRLGRDVDVVCRPCNTKRGRQRTTVN